MSGSYRHLRSSRSVPCLAGLLLVSCAALLGGCGADERALASIDTGGGQDEGIPDDPPCAIDSDCPIGTYCKGGRCTLDCRLPSDCPGPGYTCQQGRCVPPTESCSGPADCGPPRRTCVQGACVPGCGETGCPEGERCQAADGLCLAEEPPPGCQSDGDCSPPDTLCAGGTCVQGCGILGCGAGLVCAADGRCEPEAVEPEVCGGDRDCAPPDTICVVAVCVPGCLSVPCEEGTYCQPDTGRCRPGDPPPLGCQGDQDCAAGTVCDRVSGDCVPQAPQGADGDVCLRDEDCGSGLCMAIEVGGVEQRFCTRLCCTEFECLWGLGCVYVAGVRLCVPERVLGAGFRFAHSAGESCGGGGESCRSGLCDTRHDRCLSSCCRHSDCGQMACTWGYAGNTLRSFCDTLALLGEFDGAFCSDGLQCASGICVAQRESPLGGVCAAPCCSDRDCFGGLTCGMVAGPFGPAGLQGAVTYACVEQPLGAEPLGAACFGPNDGARCASGTCLEDRCTTLCCRDEDCPGGSVCRPMPNGEGSWARGCEFEE